MSFRQTSTICRQLLIETTVSRSWLRNQNSAGSPSTGGTASDDGHKYLAFSNQQSNGRHARALRQLRYLSPELLRQSSSAGSA
jgi:hypothetical protein